MISHITNRLTEIIFAVFRLYRFSFTFEIKSIGGENNDKHNSAAPTAAVHHSYFDKTGAQLI